MQSRRDVFQATADPTRREIIYFISCEPRNLNTIAGNFTVSRPAISQHIKILVECGLVVIRKRGRESYCEAKLETLGEVAEWVAQYKKIWADRFSALEGHLRNIKAKNQNHE